MVRPFHEPSVGKSSDWLTPRSMLTAIGLTYDLDPCYPLPPESKHCCVPARKVFTILDDGLAQPWCGMVFMNPPFGERYGHVPWLRRFLEHANGVAIVRAYTSSDWFHEYVVPHAETLLFPKGKTKFVMPDGTVGKAPGHGVVLIGMGEVANAALARSGLGFFVPVNPSRRREVAA